MLHRWRRVSAMVLCALVVIAAALPPETCNESQSDFASCLQTRTRVAESGINGDLTRPFEEVPAQGSHERCGGKQYSCTSQDQALRQCLSSGYVRLCSKDEIAPAVGKFCAYMWTSSAANIGYFLGNGGDGCGDDGVLMQESGGGDTGVAFDAACCEVLHGSHERCGGEQYSCKTQDQALQQCRSSGYVRLCSTDEIAPVIGKFCAYMWTSSATNTGYFLGNAGDGCGDDGVLMQESGGGDTGVAFDAACCETMVKTFIYPPADRRVWVPPTRRTLVGSDPEPVLITNLVQGAQEVAPAGSEFREPRAEHFPDDVPANGEVEVLDGQRLLELDFDAQGLWQRFVRPMVYNIPEEFKEFVTSGRKEWTVRSLYYEWLFKEKDRWVQEIAKLATDHEREEWAAREVAELYKDYDPTTGRMTPGYGTAKELAEELAAEQEEMDMMADLQNTFIESGVEVGMEIEMAELTAEAALVFPAFVSVDEQRSEAVSQPANISTKRGGPICMPLHDSTGSNKYRELQVPFYLCGVHRCMSNQTQGTFLWLSNDTTWSLNYGIYSELQPDKPDDFHRYYDEVCKHNCHDQVNCSAFTVQYLPDSASAKDPVRCIMFGIRPGSNLRYSCDLVNAFQRLDDGNLVEPLTPLDHNHFAGKVLEKSGTTHFRVHCPSRVDPHWSAWKNRILQKTMQAATIMKQPLFIAHRMAQGIRKRNHSLNVKPPEPRPFESKSLDMVCFRNFHAPVNITEIFNQFYVVSPCGNSIDKDDRSSSGRYGWTFGVIGDRNLYPDILVKKPVVLQPPPELWQELGRSPVSFEAWCAASCLADVPSAEKQKMGLIPTCDFYLVSQPELLCWKYMVQYDITLSYYDWMGGGDLYGRVRADAVKHVTPQGDHRGQLSVLDMNWNKRKCHRG